AQPFLKREGGTIAAGRGACNSKTAVRGVLSGLSFLVRRTAPLPPCENPPVFLDSVAGASGTIVSNPGASTFAIAQTPCHRTPKGDSFVTRVETVAEPAPERGPAGW